jgi:hypothetical protein
MLEWRLFHPPRDGSLIVGVYYTSHYLLRWKNGVWHEDGTHRIFCDDPDGWYPIPNEELPLLPLREE